MEMKKLLVGALAATALTVGGGAAMAAGQAPEATADVTRQEEQEPSYKGSLQAPADKEGFGRTMRARERWLIDAADQAVLVWDERDARLDSTFSALHKSMGDDLLVIKP